MTDPKKRKSPGPKFNIRPIIKGTPYGKPRPKEQEIEKYKVYLCDTCAKKYHAVKLHIGVISSIEPCFATEGCIGRARLLAITTNQQIPGIPLMTEWYIPATVYGLSYEMTRRLDQGGLIRRPHDQAPEWVKFTA